MCGRPQCAICAGCGHHSASCCWQGQCSASLIPGCKVLPCAWALCVSVRFFSLQPGATPGSQPVLWNCLLPVQLEWSQKQLSLSASRLDDALEMPLVPCAGAPLAEACAWVELLLDAGPVWQHAAEEAASRSSKKRKKAAAEADEDTPAQRLWQPSQHLLLLGLSTCMQVSAAVSAHGIMKVSW